MKGEKQNKNNEKWKKTDEFEKKNIGKQKKTVEYLHQPFHHSIHLKDSLKILRRLLVILPLQMYRFSFHLIFCKSNPARKGLHN